MVYRAAAVIGINLADVSLWEFGAFVAGWNDAHNADGEGSDAPAAMSDSDFEELLARIG